MFEKYADTELRSIQFVNELETKKLQTMILTIAKKFNITLYLL